MDSSNHLLRAVKADNNQVKAGHRVASRALEVPVILADNKVGFLVKEQPAGNFLGRVLRVVNSQVKVECLDNPQVVISVVNLANRVDLAVQVDNPVLVAIRVDLVNMDSKVKADNLISPVKEVLAVSRVVTRDKVDLVVANRANRAVCLKNK